MVNDYLYLGLAKMFFGAQADDDPAWVQLAFVVAFMVLLVLALLLSRRGERRRLQALAQEMGGEYFSRFLKGAFVALRQREVEQRVRLVSNSHTTPAYLVLEQITPLDFQLKIEVKEPWPEQPSITIDHLKKFSLGDPKFDKAFQVRTNDATKAAYWLNDSRRREALNALVMYGFTSFLAGKKTVELKMPNYKDVHLSAGKVKEYLEKLELLTRV